MSKYLAIAAGVLAVGAASAAPAERLTAAGGAGGARAQSGPPVMPVTMSLRGGVMVAPRSAGLAGIDMAVPSVSLMDGWEGRLDVDVIFKANFSEISTVVPVTFSQVHYMQDVSGHSVYYGAGAGALLGGKAKLVGKGLLGMELSPRLGVEGNLLVTSDKTMVTLVGRLHL